MRQTVLGVYDSYADACTAQRALGEAGVAQADMAIYSMSADAPAEKGPRVYVSGGDVRQYKPVFDQLEQLFARLFRRGEYPPETEDYREFIRRGGTVVSADVSEMQVDLVREVMRRAGAADIAERSNVWRNGSVDTGISQRVPLGGNPTAHDSSSQYEPATGQRDDTTLRSGRVVGTAPALEITEESSIPRETLQSSALTPEPTGDASTTAGTGEQPTALPSAEPNMVGGMQQVTTRTEGRSSGPSMVQKQLLSDEPDVGLGHTSAGVDADSSSRAASRPDASSGAEKAQHTSETGLVGDPVMGTPLDDDPYDDAFRSDYDARYANTGAPYDEYRRAYTHGAVLGQDERYRGQEWERIEPSAREDWESRYPESGWERFKAAVRHGWERVTGR